MRVRQWVCLVSAVFAGACAPLEDTPLGEQPAAITANAIPGCPEFREASHLGGSRWLLWDRWASGTSETSAVIDLATGDGRCRPDLLTGIGWMHAATGVRGADGELTLYVLARSGWTYRLLRRSLDEDAKWTAVREWTDDGGVSGRLVSEMLVRDGNDVQVVERANTEAPWELRDGVTGAWLAGPFEREPRSLSRMQAGQWLVVDDERAWTWPGEQIAFFTRDDAPPLGFDGVPPLAPSDVQAARAVALDDGTVLAADLTGVFHWSPERGPTVLMTGGPEAVRFPADGDSRTAAHHLLGTLSIVEGRPYVWAIELQQLLELAADGRPELRAVWTTRPDETAPDFDAIVEALTPRIAPAPSRRAVLANLHVVDAMPRETLLSLARDAVFQSYEYGGDQFLSWEQSVIAHAVAERLGEPIDPPETDDAPPSSADAVLAAWRESELDWTEHTSLARFAADHAEEMRLLEDDRERVVPLLLADDSWPANSALALLRAREAEPRFRALLASEEVAPACGRTYYEAESGLQALEHLHGKPLDEIDPLSAEEEARLRELELADDAEEPYDWGWSHAGFLLDAHGREVPRAYESRDERNRAFGLDSEE